MFAGRDKNLSSVLNQLAEGISQKLSGPLPGMDAHLKMAPMPDINKRFDHSERANARKSAVLILLYPEADRIKFPLIVRPEYPGVHSGQVALPGGKQEDNENNQQTALRETYEEVGVAASQIKIIGELTELYIPPSNFLVYPIIGIAESKPEFVLDEIEVMDLIQTDLDDILTDRLVKRRKVTIKENMKLEVPYFDIQGQTVWGATAMILSEFSTIVNNIIKEYK